MQHQLLEAAGLAREKAYAPYSRFAVGAALMSQSGEVFVGCNIENAVYPNGLCAERVALAHAVVHGVRRFTAIAIVADSPQVCVPCGSCRQALAEFAPDLSVIMANLRGDVEEMPLSRLLPRAFTADWLGTEEGGGDR